ncbi:hypothetical protein [Paenibacillus glucanolyticus]
MESFKKNLSETEFEQIEELFDLAGQSSAMHSIRRQRSCMDLEKVPC